MPKIFELDLPREEWSAVQLDRDFSIGPLEGRVISSTQLYMINTLIDDAIHGSSITAVGQENTNKRTAFFFPTSCCGPGRDRKSSRISVSHSLHTMPSPFCFSCYGSAKINQM